MPTVGSLNNNNDNNDGTENGKKAASLISKTVTVFTRASRFFVHFLAFFARLRRETA